MKNKIYQLQKQIEIVNEIKSLILKLYISEISESSTKTELKIIDEKFENYKNFKINELKTLQIEKEFLIVWNAETGHTEKFTIEKLREESQKEGFFEWMPTFLESEHFLDSMEVGQVELMETERDSQEDNFKVAVYRIK
jgi:hypothetical protein